MTTTLAVTALTRRNRSCPRGGRLRGGCHFGVRYSSIELGERARRIDQAPAELIVSPLRSELLRTRGQDLEDGRGVNGRMPLEEQRGNAAHMRRGNRRPGGDLIGVVGSRHRDVDARSRDCEMGALNGLTEQLVVLVGR